MPAARVTLAPPEPWSEDRLIAAARALPAIPADLRVGESIGGLLVISVMPADAPSVEVVPRSPVRHSAQIELTVLLDCAESMGTRWSAEHTRAKAAQQALVALIRNPPSRVASLSVLAFGARTVEALPPTPPGVIGEFDVPSPAGAAMAADAIETALGQGHGARAREILLLTDGPSQGAHLVDAARRAGLLGIPIHVVVFAPQEDEQLAAVARESGGSLQRAALPLVIELPEEKA